MRIFHGNNLLPEGLETGEYTIKSETDATDLTDVCPVVCATTSPVGTNENPNTYSSYCGNRYEALGYYIFKGSLMTTYDGGDQADAIDAYIKRTNDVFSNDGIVSIFMAPKKLVGWTGDGTWSNFGSGAYSYRDALAVFEHTNPIWTDYTNPIKFTDLSVTRPTTFGTYTPKNNKLFRRLQK